MIYLVRFLSSVYSFVDLPVIVLNKTFNNQLNEEVKTNKTFSTEATEEAVLLVMLSLVSVPVTLQVESFRTNGAEETIFLSLTNPVSRG